MADAATAYALGFALILVGVAIITAATILIAAKDKKVKTKTAGVIMIGPLPIVFGSDKKTVKTLLQLSIILTMTVIAALLIYYFLFR